MTAPRLIPARQLRAYLGVSGAGLCRMRKAGILPDPLPGTRLYDFEDVKRRLDQRGDTGARMSSEEQELIERARQWGKSR